MIRPLPFLLLALASLLVACDDVASPDCGPCGSASDPENGCEGCDSGEDTNSEAQAKLIVNSTFLGEDESCEVVIDNATVGNTGETIMIEPDVPTEVEVGILDGPHTTDDLPLHSLGEGWDETIWAGASVVTPKQSVTGSLTATKTLSASFNLWQKDTWWTCDEVRSWDGGTSSYTAMSYYRSGKMFYFEFGEVTVDGVNFQLDSSFTGQFISPTEATATWQQTETAYVTITCYTSDEDGNKVDADGELVTD